MVIDIGALKSGRDERVAADIGAVVDVAHAAGAIVKVILENAYLTDDEKVRGCRCRVRRRRLREDLDRLRRRAAPHEDLALMRRTVSNRVQVKAAEAFARSTTCWR